MGYAATTGVIIYWKPDKQIIQKAHHIWFNEFNSCLSIEYNHTTGALLLQQDPENHVNNSDLLNFITCELDLTSTPFGCTTIITY